MKKSRFASPKKRDNFVVTTKQKKLSNIKSRSKRNKVHVSEMVTPDVKSKNLESNLKKETKKQNVKNSVTDMARRRYSTIKRTIRNKVKKLNRRRSTDYYKIRHGTPKIKK